MNLIASNYYFIFYYNSEIWHIPSNTHNSKKLMSASALPLKMCIGYYDQNMSFQTLHNTVKRATPPQVMIYKHALILHKVYNDEHMSHEWQSLFFNQSFNNRLPYTNCVENSNFKIGKNLIENRLTFFKGWHHFRVHL